MPTKITEMETLVTLVGDELIPVISTPSETPDNKKIDVTTLTNKINYDIAMSDLAEVIDAGIDLLVVDDETIKRAPMTETLSTLLELAGEGDTIAPATNTDNNIPQWNGTDSKTLKNGLALDTDLTTVSENHDSVPSALATKTALDGKSATTHDHDTSYVGKALFDANTMLAANSDNTPLALTVNEQKVIGRATGGNIAALDIDSDLASVSANHDSVPSALATRNYIHTKANKTIIVKVFNDDETVSVGDGKYRVVIPAEVSGMDLVSVGAHVYTASTSGLPNVMIRNETDSVDMLSTAITIDANGFDSKDATTAAVINTAVDDVVEGDVIRIDVDGAGTGTRGLEVRMGFRG